MRELKSIVGNYRDSCHRLVGKSQRVWVPVVDYRCGKQIALTHAREIPMSDDPADVVEAAIRSASSVTQRKTIRIGEALTAAAFVQVCNWP